MKKIGIFLLAFTCLCAALVSCGKTAAPSFQDSAALAKRVYLASGFSTDDVYAEMLNADSAYTLGINASEFTNLVENAVVYRRTIDSNGRTLYAVKAKSEDAARRLAESFCDSYEWAPCDNAEKLAVACAGDCLIVMKSDSDEVDAMLAGFRQLSGERLLYQRELVNKGA